MGSHAEKVEQERTNIAIIGTGFSGLAIAAQLKLAGIDDFLLLERASDIGGTWRDNVYPGAFCDIESNLYSFSFEPHPFWSHRYASQSEIFFYLKHCAQKYKLWPHIRLQAEVKSAEFDSKKAQWKISFSSGKELFAQFLVACCGPLNRPFIPPLKGAEKFSGKIMHSMFWDDSLSVEGKRVAVLGTGASAVQIIPSIVNRVKYMYVVQRTPPWVVPRNNPPRSQKIQHLFQHFPTLQKVSRMKTYMLREGMALGFVWTPQLLQNLSVYARRHLKRSIRDQKLIEKLTPHYSFGCKRICASNHYYPSFNLPQVELITEKLTELTSDAIVFADGSKREIDLLVLATGFNTAESMAPFQIKGLHEEQLNEKWEHNAQAYLGTSVPNFPNLFFIVGPNTGLGHNSLVYMIESQVHYILSAIKVIRRRSFRYVHVRKDVMKRYNDGIQKRLSKSVWSRGGCTSWYLTSEGKNTCLWPGFSFEFRFLTRAFDERDYVCVT